MSNEEPQTYLMTTFEDYKHCVQLTLMEHPTWREGQAAFTTLWTLHENLANEVHTGKLDPFVRDDRLPEFYTFVEENWNDARYQ